MAERPIFRFCWIYTSNHFPILVRCKTKGAVGAVCALLLNWQLGAELPITLRDVAVTYRALKG
jgi:hypothetical protein